MLSITSNTFNLGYRMKEKRKNINIPVDISLLINAIKCDNNDTAKLLIQRTMDAIFKKSDPFSNKVRWSDNELDIVVNLISSINPKDTVECILAAQFIFLHLKSMAIFAEDNHGIMGQAMMMVRLSHQCLTSLRSLGQEFHDSRLQKLLRDRIV